MSGTAFLNELRRSSPLISVGMLTADLLSLGSELALIEQAGVKLVHVDVIDGCFCPMLTVGPPLIKVMRTSMFKDVHLLIENPLEKIESYVAAGADMITVHAESGRHIHRLLQLLGSMTNINDPDRGILRGIALNPGTPLEVIWPLLDEVEIILLLAVNPGWVGQKFICSTKSRLGQLREMVRNLGKEVLVCVDGGVKRDNIADIARMGPDIIVAGSAVFDGKDPPGNAKYMIKAVSEAVNV